VLYFSTKYDCITALVVLYFSTITTWGKDGEVEAFRNMLTRFPDGLVACVSDSYNIWDACEKVWGGKLKSLVEQRKNGSLVVRPDSGDPPTVVVQVNTHY
jgi:nicotinamide phosphoribosyltransferase